MKGNSPTRLPTDLLWEESIVLIEAESAEDASVKARMVAKAAETEYVSAAGETISWKLDRIERLYEIGESLSAGKEVFSRFLRNSEVESLLTPFPE
jgi:transcriptional antiterminator Rof (Rho-off)